MINFRQLPALPALRSVINKKRLNYKSWLGLKTVQICTKLKIKKVRIKRSTNMYKIKKKKKKKGRSFHYLFNDKRVLMSFRT